MHNITPHTDVKPNRGIHPGLQFAIAAATREISKMAVVVYQDGTGIYTANSVVTPPMYTKLNGQVVSFPVAPWNRA